MPTKQEILARKMAQRDSMKKQIAIFTEELLGCSGINVDEEIAKLDKCFDKYGNNFTLNCTILDNNGRKIVSNVPMESLFDGTQEPIVIDKKVQSIEIFVKCVTYEHQEVDGKLFTKKITLGGSGDKAKIISHTIAFSDMMDKSKLQKLKDAKVFSKKEFAAFSMFNVEGQPLNKKLKNKIKNNTLSA